MIKSMTGYGRAELMTETVKITAELKAVNHRFSDYSIRMPRHLLSLEDRVRSLAGEYITRGKTDIFITVESFGEDDKEIVLNEALAASYIKALSQLRDKFGLRDDMSVSSVSRYPDIFKAERKEIDEDAMWEQIKPVFTEALENFTAMRAREGARIYEDLNARVNYMKSLAEKIDEKAPAIVSEYQSRLYEKIKETIGDRDIDEGRVLTEVAIFADKVAINEELVRLKSHFEEYSVILSGDEPAGRRLDFLIQEINREINTIGSKANDMDVAKLVVELKAELEKLREQIQNIE